jgi:hypothetical protein
MEVHETGHNCEEKADRQIIGKYEQRCMNDSDCCGVRDQVVQKAFTHVLQALTQDWRWSPCLSANRVRPKGFAPKPDANLSDSHPGT